VKGKERKAENRAKKPHIGAEVRRSGRRLAPEGES